MNKVSDEMKTYTLKEVDALRPLSKKLNYNLVDEASTGSCISVELILFEMRNIAGYLK